VEEGDLLLLVLCFLLRQALRRMQLIVWHVLHGSIHAAIRVTPVLPGAKLRIASLIAPVTPGRLVIGRDKARLVAHDAIVRGLDLVPDDEAVLVHAAVVDADRLDLAADHHAIEPGARPFDPALEMGAALGDARRPQDARGNGGEPGLLQLVD